MKLQTLSTGAVALLLIGGCASTTPYFDQHLGMAVNTAKAQQTLNPEGSRNPDPVAGIDGIAADNTVDEYHNSFKAPAPTFPVINIGVGGGAR